ncbi:MAG: hypothetical protein P1V36_02395, partial [Planctomycetota bacterium]|nr:hypothetical protein [Planctomycetota bacterium]
MEPHWLQAAYDDFDAFAADAPGFDLEIKQLDRGPFASDMRVVLGANVQVSWAAFARSLEVAGDLPLDTRTFVVATDDAALWMWRGEAVCGSDLLVYPRDAAIDLISRPGWSVFAVSIGIAHMAATLDREGLPAAVLDRRSRLPLKPGALDVLRDLLALVLRAPPGMDVARALDEEVPRTIARLLRDDAPTAPPRADARG